MSLYKPSALGKKLLIRILWVSSFITLTLSVFQLYRDYNIDVDLIDQCLELIEKTSLEGIIYNLWTFNNTVLQIQLDGLQRIQDVEYVAIVSAKGQLEQFAGALPDAEIILKAYPMVYNLDGETIGIGELHVVASLSGVYQRLQDKVIIILLTQGIKTFIVSDSLGHETGDQLLIQFSERVLKSLRHEDTFARLGGDEFVILSSSSLCSSDRECSQLHKQHAQ